MNRNKEILKSHFEENEYQDVETRIEQDETFKEAYEKLKNSPDYRLTRLEERVDKTVQSFEERFEAFKKAVLEAERELSSKPSTPEEILAQKKDELEKEYKDSLSKIPIFWTFLSWLFDAIEESKKAEKWDIWKKIWWWIAWFILWFFGYKKFKEKLDSVQVDTSDIPHIGTPIETLEAPELQEQREVSIEDKKKTHFKIWKLIVKHLWSVEFDSRGLNSDTNFDSLKDVKYNEIEEKSNDNDGMKKVKEAITSRDMEIIFENILTKDNIEKLLKREKTKKLLENIWINKSEGFDWRSLEIENLFCLLSISVSWLVTLWAKWLWNQTFELLNSLFTFAWENLNLEHIKEEADEFEEEVMPKELFLKLQDINSSNVTWIHGSDSINYTKEEILWNFEQEEKEKYEKYIDKILKFRDFVKQEILNNERFMLWMWKIIKNETSFFKVIELYLVFWWEVPENIDSYKSSMVYSWIFNNLRKSNNEWAYYVELNKEINSKDERYIKNDDKEFLRLIATKIIENLIIDPASNYWEKILKSIEALIMKNKEEVTLWIWAIISLVVLSKWKILKLLFSRLWMYSIWISAFASFYYMLDPANRKIIRENISEEDFRAIEDSKRNNEEIREYNKIQWKREHTYWILKITLWDNDIPFFEINWKKYKTNVWWIWPDEWMLNEAYFWEKNWEIALCFDRSQISWWNVVIPIKDIITQVEWKNPPYTIKKDAFFYVLDLELEE